MLQRFVKVVGGDPHRRLLLQLSQEIRAINALEPKFERLSDGDLRARTAEFKARLASLAQSIVVGAHKK